MVLNYHGLYVSQEQIVARVFGGLVDSPASSEEILAALSGWAPDNRGRYSSIYADPYVFNDPDLVWNLAYKWPIIVGLQSAPIGHAYVLTAVHYRLDPYGVPIVEKVVLRDPWPTRPSRQELNWAEFRKRLMFSAGVYVRRH